MPTTEFDYLIIGQGVAGTILAHTLITRGLRVMVIDNAHTGSSSKVAAGIINPITGPRLKNNEQFHHYFAKASAYYAKLEYHIKQSVFKPVNQRRKIQSDQQFEFLQKRLSDPLYQKLIQVQSNILGYDLFKMQQHPTVSIQNTHIVDTSTLLSAGQQWLAGLNSYSQCKLDYSQLRFSNNHVQWHNISAKKIIFCEGYQAINNPWLSHLPFKLAKGEILTLDTASQNNQLGNTMLSWDKWLVPFGNTAKLGSNFAWNNLELTPDANIKQSLLTSLHTNTKINANVIKHEVGIRPSTRQREPFVGQLSTNSIYKDNAYCFNGFGSKGCLLIPFYADLLADHLQHQTPLPSKVTQWL